MALFTFLLVAILLAGGWAIHHRMSQEFEDAGARALLDQGQLLAAALEADSAGIRAAWRRLDVEALRLAGGLDRLELLDLAGNSIDPDPAALPGPLPPAAVLGELHLGLHVLPPAEREGEEVYQSLYWPLREEQGEVAGALVLEAGLQTSRHLAVLKRALWLATGLGVLFTLFVLLSMAGILRQASRRQRDLDRAEHLARVGTLAAGLAHEIRNPMAIIAGNAEMIEMQASEAPERTLLSQRAADILAEVERLQALLQDFLQFARPQDLKLERVDPLAFWNKALAEQATLHPQVDFALEAESALPDLQADPARLRQLALNLLGNAAEAAGPGGKVRLRLRAKSRKMVAVFEDDGPGVPESLRERLFLPFVSGKEGGSGLGLAVSAAVARAHGGELRLTQPGPGGTAFTLSLPLHPQGGGSP